MKKTITATIAAVVLTCQVQAENRTPKDEREPTREDLVEGLEQLGSLALTEDLRMAAESYRLTVEESDQGVVTAQPGRKSKKMRKAFNKLKAAAAVVAPQYENKPFQCKSDYDLCEPKARSWRSGPWSCEVAFVTCLSECVIASARH